MTQAVAAPGKLVTISMDGRTFEAPARTTILELARENGIYIPTLCYLKKLLPIGSCRVCSVEVEGVDGPVMSCITPVAEGMSVTTQSPALIEHRRQMIQYILVNHPLDCPVCERSGECSLQDRTFEFGITGQIFATADYAKVPVVDWGVIRYDENLCIMCERCVKICHEIQGFNALKIDGTGYSAKINTIDGEKLDCDFCGQCLAVCPVGSLNSGITLSARSWEITKTESICPHCAVGCSYHINTRGGQIVRITSDDGIGINNGNLCVRGRFGFEAFQSESRIRTPLARDGMTVEPVSWDYASSEAADRLKAIRGEHGPESVAVIVSESIPNEDGYLLQKVFRAGLGINRIDTLSNIRNSGLNSGMFDLFGPSAPIASYEEIGKAGSLMFFGCDAARENPVIANIARVAMRDKGTPLIIANARDTSDFFPPPNQMLRHHYGAETILIAALIRAVTGENCGGLDPASAAGRVDDPGALVKTAGAVDPGEAAVAAGVTEEQIEEAARILAGNPAPLIFLGKDIHDHPASADIMRAIANLANLTGGKTLLFREYSNSQGMNDMGVSPTHFPGYMKADDPGTLAYYSEKWGAELLSPSPPRSDIFSELAEGTIKALFIVGCDPISYFPDGQFVREALQKTEFIALAGSYASETSLLADVIFPTCSITERDGTYTSNEGRVQLIRKAIEPVGESRPEWMVIQELAGRLGLDVSYESSGRIAEEIARTVPGYEGLTHQNLSRGGAFVSYPGADGKAEGYDFNTETLAVSSGGRYPFTAMIGNSRFHLGEATRRSEALNMIDPRAWVEVNPQDAAALDMRDGAEALIESRQGSIQAVLRVTGRSPKGVVFIAQNFENAPAYHLVYRNEAAVQVKITKA